MRIELLGIVTAKLMQLETSKLKIKMGYYIKNSALGNLNE